jgi:hypothetical protein
VTIQNFLGLKFFQNNWKGPTSFYTLYKYDRHLIEIGLIMETFHPTQFRIYSGTDIFIRSVSAAQPIAMKSLIPKLYLAAKRLEHRHVHGSSITH